MSLIKVKKKILETKASERIVEELCFLKENFHKETTKEPQRYYQYNLYSPTKRMGTRIIPTIGLEPFISAYLGF